MHGLAVEMRSWTVRMRMLHLRRSMLRQRKWRDGAIHEVVIQELRQSQGRRR